MQKITNRIAISVVAAALILASVQITDIPSRHTLWRYPIMALILFLIGVGLGGSIAVSVLLSDHRARSREEHGPR